MLTRLKRLEDGPRVRTPLWSVGSAGDDSCIPFYLVHIVTFLVVTFVILLLKFNSLIVGHLPCLPS